MTAAGRGMGCGELSIVPVCRSVSRFGVSLHSNRLRALFYTALWASHPKSQGAQMHTPGSELHLVWGPVIAFSHRNACARHEFHAWLSGSLPFSPVPQPLESASAICASSAAITSRPRGVAIVCIGLWGRLKRIRRRAARARNVSASLTRTWRSPEACAISTVIIGCVSFTPSTILGALTRASCPGLTTPPRFAEGLI